MNNQSLKAGTLLHKSTYRIEQVLGQGSFGITYLATHVALNKKVAIKEFFMKDLNGRSEDGSITGMSDGSLSMDYARKFRKEALNLADLDHPNIVRVTDSFEDNGTFYYVMDYIDGENLNDYIKFHPVSQQEAVDIIRAVTSALRYMHEEKHMLHLDLKPGNIMRRSADGHIFLIDFGLSKHYSQDGQPETSTTIGLGTPGYAPVEQGNQAKSGDFRPTIDVYALGATFYKLLTHETPPPASELVSDDELLVNKLNEHNIDSNLSAIVVNAMLPNVKKRIPTARAFNNDVTSALAKSNNAEEKEETQTADASANNIAGSSEISPKLEEEKERTRTANASKNGTETEEEPKVSKIEEEKKQRLIAFFISAFFAALLFLIAYGVSFFQSKKPTKSATVSDTIRIENLQTRILGDDCTYSGLAIQLLDTYIPNGDGEVKFRDGRYYKGHVKLGELTGDNAFFHYPNGDTFQGSFEKDHFSKGKYTVKKTGEYFVGSFDTSGQPYKGTWYEATGKKIEEVRN